MILPVVAYGSSILRQKCRDIHPRDEGSDTLISDMWDTLYRANGCGLAAPQVNVPVRLFLVDSQLTYRDLGEEERLRYFQGDQGIREVFINAQITARSVDTWKDQEGCLSIPGLTVTVERPWAVTIKYLDASWKEHIRTFTGITARMIQHEYDHIEGRLFLDYLDPGKRMLIRSKLARIQSKKIRPAYPMTYR